uniref:Cytochrome P450 n=1 Tax=Oryza brachyantha TaxID=4533 RepID=J3NBE5_ORYBR
MCAGLPDRVVEEGLHQPRRLVRALLRRSPMGTVHVHVLGCTVTANVEYMLKTCFDNFPKGKPFAALLGDLLGNGIFNVDGGAWRHQRKMASLELGSVSVRSYAFKIIAQEVETRLMPKRGSDSNRFAFDTICKISFGLDSGCLDRDMLASELASRPFDSKFCAAADVLPDGTYVDGDARVMYHPYAMGRMPRIWGADCDAFRPDRWLTGAGGTFVPESLYKYPVFQAGLRVCLGKELAVTEMKAVSVAVVRAFDVEVVGENGRSSAAAAPRFVPGLTASIRGGLPVKIRRV